MVMEMTTSEDPEKWTLSDVVALAALRPLVEGYVPWTTWSMRPSAILTVVNEIELKQRSTVVELGAGASTLYLARAMANVGGRLVSIEQDPELAEFVRRLVARAGLSRVASVEQVGLSPLPPTYRVDSTAWTSPEVWYDIDRLRVVCPVGIDVLVVDAPPGGNQERVLVREPAVNALRGQLAAEYSIFLDDTDRPAERETLRRWGDHLGIATHIVERISLGLGRSDGGFMLTL
jgi:hypothetical protein